VISGRVGTLTVGGAISGAGSNPVTFSLAQSVQTPEIAVRSVLLKGSVLSFELGVGGNFGAGAPVSVGTISVLGSFMKSRIAVGTADGNDDVMGTLDDTINAGSVLNRLVIKSTVSGTSPIGDYYGILAGKIASATLNGRLLPLGSGAQTLSVAPTSDVFVRDAL
jgi:hypothetical protein